MSWRERFGIEDEGAYDQYTGQITYIFRNSSKDGEIVARIEQESYAPIPDEGDRIYLEISKADFIEENENWALTGSESLEAMVVTSVNYIYNYLFFERSAGPKGQRLLTSVEIWGEPIQSE